MAASVKRVGWAAFEPGKKLQEYTYTTTATVGANEVDIKAESAFPMIPGHELIGTIVSAGSGVTEFKVGQRVGVGFLRDACMQCANCKSGQQNICLRGAKGMVHPVAEGVGARGCFQDVVHANTAFVFAIPDELDSASAAPLMCAGVTVYAPLKRNLTKPGMRVAIIGTGGLGHLAVQFASAMGGIVTAVDTVEAKATTAKMLGAAEACTFDTFVKGSCGRFDLVLDCSTVLKDAAPLLEALVPGGTLVCIGIPGAGLNLQVPLLPLVYYQKHVEGSNVGGRVDTEEMLRFAVAKKIKTVTEKYPMSKVNEAIEHLDCGKAVYRVVLECGK